MSPYRVLLQGRVPYEVKLYEVLLRAIGPHEVKLCMADRDSGCLMISMGSI